MNPWLFDAPLKKSKKKKKSEPTEKQANSPRTTRRETLHEKLKGNQSLEHIKIRYYGVCSGEISPVQNYEQLDEIPIILRYLYLVKMLKGAIFVFNINFDRLWKKSLDCFVGGSLKYIQDSSSDP